MAQVSITGWSCDVCGWRWSSRTDRKPLRCAKCKTPYWDKSQVAAKGVGFEPIVDAIKRIGLEVKNEVPNASHDKRGSGRVHGGTGEPSRTAAGGKTGRSAAKVHGGDSPRQRVRVSGLEVKPDDRPLEPVKELFRGRGKCPHDYQNWMKCHDVGGGC